jgi:hypothetical protein
VRQPKEDNIMTTNTRHRHAKAATTILAGAAAIAVGALGPAAPANADAGNQYVVIAYSPVNGAHGWVNNVNSFDQAYHSAIGLCVKFGGQECQLGAWDHGGCAAVIADVGNDWSHWAGRGGADLQGAEGAAVYANGGGQVVLSRCATGNQGDGT